MRAVGTVAPEPPVQEGAAIEKSLLNCVLKNSSPKNFAPEKIFAGLLKAIRP